MAASDLHFWALEQDRRAAALRDQVKAAFTPYRVFLQQAVKGAEERQATAVVNWQPVTARRFQLQATTSEVELVAEDAGMIVTGVPTDTPLDVKATFYRESDERYFRADPLERQGDSVRVAFGVEAPDVGDTLRWKGHAVTLEAAVQPVTPDTLVVNGAHLKVTRAEQEDEALQVRVQGLHPINVVEAPAGWRVRAVRHSEPAGRQVRDEKQVAYDVLDGASIALPKGAPAGQLRDETGCFFKPVETFANKRDGRWIRLELDDERDGDDGVDPRNAFFDAEATEVWAITPKEVGTRRNGQVMAIRKPLPSCILKVRDRDRDTFEISVDNLPPEDRTLICLPLDTRQLKQRQAIVYRLQDAPLEHHRALLRLFERPQDFHVPPAAEEPEPVWRVLADSERSGTDQQRRFVRKALATRDLAVLEGPPGSGKTTAILELVVQFLSRGQRVLLCATTNFAIDNVLERIADEGRFPGVFPIRIGKAERIDEKLGRFVLDARVAELERSLRAAKTLPAGIDVAACARSLVLDAANLVCGTTTGVLAHPWLRSDDSGRRGQGKHRLGQPLFDVMIIDEASKTTVPEFLVPAAYARKWIIVGDKRQLSPFADRAELVANLTQAQLDDSQIRTREGAEPPRISRDAQRACHILFELGDVPSDARWLVVESDGVVEAMWKELLEAEPKPAPTTDGPGDAVSPTKRGPQGLIVRITERAASGNDGSRLRTIDLPTIERGDSRSLALAAASVVLVPSGLLDRVWRFLPANACIVPRRDNLPVKFGYRRDAAVDAPLARSFSRRGKSIATTTAIESFVGTRLAETTWAAELAWRLIRQHELKAATSKHETDRLGREVVLLKPMATRVGQAVESVQQIALPSIIESLQVGVRSSLTRSQSLLGIGFDANDTTAHLRTAWQERFEPLTFQHRMHPAIAAFPRGRFYEGKRLEDANTIELRDMNLGWAPEWRVPPPDRSCWLNVEGREARGRNADEVAAIRQKLVEFLAWAKGHPPRRANEPNWQVGVLSFYLGQQEALSDMLKSLTQSTKKLRFEVSNVEIVCGTVDRFQGREADIVFLSFRNTGKKGFLDSMNRLNVALTRARQQLVLVGKQQYWRSGKHQVEELTALGEQATWEAPTAKNSGGRQWR